MKKLLATALLSSLVISAGVHADSVMNGEFKSLQSCLNSIVKSSGFKITKLTVDKPSEVSGFLSNGKVFACERKVTGTRGIYFHGWYMVE